MVCIPFLFRLNLVFEIVTVYRRFMRLRRIRIVGFHKTGKAQAD